MCGISVVFDSGESPGSGEALLRMHEAIPHRGPDGEGFLVSDHELRARPVKGNARLGALRLGMAFRRLKILDLSEASDQPMGSPDGSVWLVFNGELYNHRELRQQLESKGRRFRSSGDAEVVLAAYEAWGEDCFRRFEGMWALVVADLRRRRLVGSRDRFGIKPLCWAKDGDRLLLASEAKQILRARAGRPRANAQRVALYLRGARLPCLDDSFFEGVGAVPPASWFEIPLDRPLGAPRFQRYWELSSFGCPQPDRFPLAYPAAVAELRERLEAAVASHARADVTVGSLLSGGLDSSTLVSLLNRTPSARDAEHPTFSFGFRGAQPPFDELRYVDQLVRHDGLINHETSLDANWLTSHLSDVVRALEEPPLALAALGQYRVFGLARAHGVKVVFDGQGADEILGGYAYHQRDLLVDRLRRGRLLELHSELRAIGRRQSCGSWQVLAGLFGRPAAARLMPPRRAWLARDFGRTTAGNGSGAPALDRSDDPSRVNRRLYFDVRWGNAKLILGFADRNAMAHSVEARVPYFDRQLVEFAFSLPDHYKVGDGERKRILRDMARPYLPREITERPDRTGFAVPEQRMMREGVWRAAREVVLDRASLASPCFVARPLRQLVAACEDGRAGDGRALWRAYALGVWRAEFDVTLG